MILTAGVENAKSWLLSSFDWNSISSSDELDESSELELESDESIFSDYCEGLGLDSWPSSSASITMIGWPTAQIVSS